MFDQLVSSKAGRQVAPMRGVVVGMLHGVMIMGAVRVTARPADPPASAPLPIQVIYEARPVPVASTTVSDPGAVIPSAPVPDLPPAPVDVPPSIPPVTSGPAIDPERLRQAFATGLPGVRPGGGDSLMLGGVLASAQVDDPAVIVRQPSPRYPPVLQQAGLEGRVLVEFVIDTTGHMEAASLRVLESSNPGFDSAAGETVRHSLFRPARVHGRPVRQRTTQSIAFRIAPE